MKNVNTTQQFHLSPFLDLVQTLESTLEIFSNIWQIERDGITALKFVKLRKLSFRCRFRMQPLLPWLPTNVPPPRGNVYHQIDREDGHLTSTSSIIVQFVRFCLNGWVWPMAWTSRLFLVLLLKVYRNLM